MSMLFMRFGLKFSFVFCCSCPLTAFFTQRTTFPNDNNLIEVKYVSLGKLIVAIIKHDKNDCQLFIMIEQAVPTWTACILQLCSSSLRLRCASCFKRHCFPVRDCSPQPLHRPLSKLFQPIMTKNRLQRKNNETNERSQNQIHLAKPS